MRFNKLEIDPARNPAILDTATWDTEAAWATVQAVDDAYWAILQDAILTDAPLPPNTKLTPYSPSFSQYQGNAYALAGLPDGQQVFLEVGSSQRESVLGAPIGTKSLPAGGSLALYPTDAAVIDRFVRFVKPEHGPKALGPVPRLGIGTCMTTAVWPAIWKAMRRYGFAANAIQNSVRELNLLEDLLGGRPPETNVAFGFGVIEAGYTGSTFEGLWVAGVLDALKHGAPPQYGADADHIQVKRGPDGLERARRLVEAARYYSFFTLDVADVLDYVALSAGPAAASAFLDARIPDLAERKAIAAYHQQPRCIAGFEYRPDEITLGRLVGKYWTALDAVATLCAIINTLKDGLALQPGSGEALRPGSGRAFDLELSIDEHPPEIATVDCLTLEAELIFVLLEAQRRGIPLTHVAPNFGIEKGTDYRCPDGLKGLEARARSLSRIAEAFGVMVDFHSGDDLGSATRRVIGRATGGRSHFKVSPMLQVLFGQVLQDFHPELFRRWWEDALAYAKQAAAGGSRLAAESLREDQAANNLSPSAHSNVFHHFSFAFIGRRDAKGRFLHREEFYSLSPAFYRAYQDRLVSYLGELAEDLFPAI